MGGFARSINRVELTLSVDNAFKSEKLQSINIILMTII